MHTIEQPYGWAIWAFGAMIGFASVKLFGFVAVILLGITYGCVIWYLSFKFLGRNPKVIETDIIEGEVCHDDDD